MTSNDQMFLVKCQFLIKINIQIKIPINRTNALVTNTTANKPFPWISTCNKTQNETDTIGSFATKNSVSTIASYQLTKKFTTLVRLLATDFGPHQTPLSPGLMRSIHIMLRQNLSHVSSNTSHLNAHGSFKGHPNQKLQPWAENNACDL